jgi:hypothetical protein
MAQQQRVEVQRGFRHKQAIVGPGSVLDLDKQLAIELRSANKVKFVASDVKLISNGDLPDPNKILAARQKARAAAKFAADASFEAAVKAEVEARLPAAVEVAIKAKSK